MVGMHAALTKKVDDGFIHLNEKVDHITEALLGCIEDGTVGIIAKVQEHDKFIAQVRAERSTFITLFIGALVTVVVSGIGAAIWVAVRMSH